MDLREADVRASGFGTLLRHVGCTATASAEARLYGGDELVSRRAAQPADFGSAREMLRLTLSAGRGSGLKGPGLAGEGGRGQHAARGRDPHLGL